MPYLKYFPAIVKLYNEKNLQLNIVTQHKFPVGCNLTPEMGFPRIVQTFQIFNLEIKFSNSPKAPVCSKP